MEQGNVALNASGFRLSIDGGVPINDLLMGLLPLSINV